MVEPTPDGPVRLHLKCSGTEEFIELFAPNVTRGGIFLPSREPRDVGASIRFEVMLLDDRVVFAGDGVVMWVKPKGMGVKFTKLDPATEPVLERLLARRQGGQPVKAAPPAAAAPSLATVATPAAAPRPV